MENLEHLPGRDAFCRACMANLNEASDDPTSAPNYNIFSSNIQLDKKIMQCTNFECSPWDGYSHVVCHHCYVKILDFYDFQCVYRSSMEKFKVLLENELDFKDEDDEKMSTISSVECDNNSFQINEENIYHEDVHADNISGTAEDPLNSEDFANTQDVKNEKSSKSPKHEFEIKEIGLKTREVRSTKLSPRRSGRKRKLHASKEEDNSTSDNEINSIEDLHHRSDDDDEQVNACWHLDKLLHISFSFSQFPIFHPNQKMQRKKSPKSQYLNVKFVRNNFVFIIVWKRIDENMKGCQAILVHLKTVNVPLIAWIT